MVSVIEALVISPGPVAREVFEQVFAHIFVLRANEAEAEQEGAEGEGGVLADLCFPHECFLLVDGLCRDGQRQGNICPDLTCVECALKAAPFQCAAVENRMKVQGIIPGFVVVFMLSLIHI